MNYKLLLTYIALAMWSFPSFLYGQGLVINEIMSSNVSYLEDKDGEFSDWIEIYNSTNQDINLNGYHLSDDENDLDKWTFPSVVIPPYGFLLVFASDKNSLNIAELHTNFKIRQEEEMVILSKPNNEILSKIDAIQIPEDYSYGCVPDGSDTYSIFKSPSHNASNAFSNGIYTSHESGFYLKTFYLILKSSDPNQQIYFTTNGNIPTVNDHLFTDTLKMVNNICKYSLWCTDYYSMIPTTPLDGPNRLQEYIWKEPQTLYRTNVIRYASFSGDTMKSDVHTKTYFIDPNIDVRYQFPIISLATDSLNLFDYKTGIYIPGKRFDDQGFGYRPSGNYLNTGIDWERKTHITFLEHDGTVGFETDAGIRIRGVGSTANPQKSLNVYFRKEYGEKDVDYPVFDEYINTEFKRLVLRNSGNDFLDTHFRDGLLQNILKPLGLELQRFRPSIVFINGEYWGIHNIREKYDKFYFEYNFGISVENLNLLNCKGEIEEGSNLDYLALLDYVETEDLTEDFHYEYVKSQIDMENFIDFQIAEIYFANYDWPCNNYKIWKTNDIGSKWRFLVYDLDYSYGFTKESEFDAKSLEHASSDEIDWPHCPVSNALFRALLKNENFKQEFVKRFSLHLNTVFNVDTVLQKINSFENLHFPEMAEHIERWNYPHDFEEWYKAIDAMKYFTIHRPCYIKNHLMDFFQLEDIDFECPIFKEYEKEELFQIFPNPNNGQFTIKKNSLFSTVGTITVLNIEGKLIYTKENVKLDNYNQENIDLQELTGLINGVYFVCFQSQRLEFTQKMVVIR